MSKYIKIFEYGTAERERLELAADLLSAISPNGWRYYVGETYFDYGQNWKWTTVLCDGGNFGGYQALSPAEQERIITADVPELAAIAADVMAGKFCPDRLKR